MTAQRHEAQLVVVSASSRTRCVQRAGSQKLDVRSMSDETTEVLARRPVCGPLTSTFVVGTAGFEPTTSASRSLPA